MTSTVWLANPRGFCAGVERAIEIVELLLKQHGAPIYVKHEVVHNKRVIDKLQKKGVKFIEDPKVVPPGSILIFSAHGVSQAIRKVADEQGLKVHDATCPLVTKVHSQVQRMHADGKEIIMIGHKGHPEVEGTMGQVVDNISLVETIQDAKSIEVKDPDKLAYVTQTTLSVSETKEIIDELTKRFPTIRGPAKEDICYATTNRQEAVKAMSTDCDLVLVVGSKTSSNSNRLQEVAKQYNIPAYLIDGADDIQQSWLVDKQKIGITAGASAPEELVSEVLAELNQHFEDLTVTELQGVTENITFSVPKTLMRNSA